MPLAALKQTEERVYIAVCKELRRANAARGIETGSPLRLCSIRWKLRRANAARGIETSITLGRNTAERIELRRANAARGIETLYLSVKWN